MATEDRRRGPCIPRAVAAFVTAVVVLLADLIAVGAMPSAGAPALGPARALTSDARSLASPGEARQASTPGAAQAGRPAYFPETGFAIDEPRFLEYFVRRGQLPTFGFPISRTLRFQGLPTQFFQRIVLQLWPDGSVRPLNLLDPGLLPYTRINGSTFPAPNERLAALAPAPGQPGYAREVLEFVRANAPDTFNGQPVRFFSTFNTTVTAETAFPRGTTGDPNLLPLINLEIWGVPTSLPAQDPNNGGFIYQRFQRGIMHYDAACRCTQGLLLADYFKAIITGENLPADLAAQAAGSPFLKQYAADRPSGLRQVSALPGTDLAGAFLRQAAPAESARLPEVRASAVSGPGAATGAGPASLRSRIRLGDGLANAIDVLEAGGQTGLLQAIVDSDTEIGFGVFQESGRKRTDARYSRIGSSRGDAIRSIVVNERWRQADPKALATLIVHEGTHLEDDLSGMSPSTPEVCFQFEIRAFTQQAVAWQAFYGPDGKASPRDELDVELNMVLSVYRRGPADLEKHVRQLYADSCSRPGPRSH